MKPPALMYLSMSSDQKNLLIEKLLKENEALRKKLASYEKPKKTDKNSSLLPSQTEKAKLKRKAKLNG